MHINIDEQILPIFYCETVDNNIIKARILTRLSRETALQPENSASKERDNPVD